MFSFLKLFHPGVKRTIGGREWVAGKTRRWRIRGAIQPGDEFGHMTWKHFPQLSDLYFHWYLKVLKQNKNNTVNGLNERKQRAFYLFVPAVRVWNGDETWGTSNPFVTCSNGIAGNFNTKHTDSPAWSRYQNAFICKFLVSGNSRSFQHDKHSGRDRCDTPSVICQLSLCTAVKKCVVFSQSSSNTVRTTFSCISGCQVNFIVMNSNEII